MPIVQTVLGIDAAWTEHNPSGVALIGFDGVRWRCLCVAPSYAQFVEAGAGTPVDWSGGILQRDDVGMDAVLNAATRLAGGVRPAVLAVDIPIAKEKFGGRRPADRAVSRTFGGRLCAAHSPSPERPGRVGERLTNAILAEGFALRVRSAESGCASSLIEVYPHPAAMALTGDKERVRYKISKSSSYWPRVPPLQRRANLLANWRRILHGLSTQMDDVPTDLLCAWRPTDSAAFLKRYEDGLDALVCAYVAIVFLLGEASALGDEDKAAIWVPSQIVPPPPRLGG